jgi:hypothetical protein
VVVRIARTPAGVMTGNGLSTSLRSGPPGTTGGATRPERTQDVVAT